MDLMGVGTAEVLMILLVALLVIGPKRVVELGRTMGKIVRAIKKASFDMTSSLTKELELEEDKHTPNTEKKDKQEKSNPLSELPRHIGD